MRLWPFGRQKTALTAEQRDKLAQIVSTAKYELIPLKNVRERAEALPPGTVATVTASPTHGIEATFDVAEWIAARGHEVIPHLAARMVRDRAHLSELVARARAAGFRRVFVVGGDAAPAGEFLDGLSLLRALEEIGHPFEEIGVPSYPEGHASIPDEALMHALKEKQRYAHSTSTQMSFNPEAVAGWIARIRADGITLPVHLGIPGAVELTKLMRIATQIGVAESARYLSKNPSMIGFLVNPGSFGPEAFLASLAPTIADPAANVAGLHVFTFNHVAETAAWQKKMLEELQAEAPVRG
jgi:methylenetetrahydrofolate reductase (NADPH)